MIKKTNIEIILSHFKGQLQLFPRMMMTSTSNGQFRVFSIEEIFEQCKNSNFTDCRINGYAEYIEYKGILRQPPNFIFVDMDLANFDFDRRRLDLALNNTLKRIKKYHGFPTVVWTGNGYHIYQPIEAIILDQQEIFSKDWFPNLFSLTGKYSNWFVSEVFLKYAEIFFTSGKADPLHKPKYKTCLIRIPGSYNSKLIKQGKLLEEAEVKVIQQWDSHKIPIQSMLRDFRRWITQEEINQRLQNNENKKFHRNRSSIAANINIDWIEKLLQTPLENNRKYCLFHILVPYLLNIKKMSANESIHILDKWLEKCSEIRSLDFNPSIELNYRIKFVKGYKPLGIRKLKEQNIGLYDKLKYKEVLG